MSYLGAVYGDFNLKQVFRGADVCARHIYALADDLRERMKAVLQEPYENQSICICPDLWTDPYKQISYMGISISFVDKDINYQSFDLCCEPFVQVDHTGESVIMVISCTIRLFIPLTTRSFSLIRE